MTKLYHNGQLEGWQLPGEQDKAAARVDVPSSPADLKTWLNHRRVGPSGAAAELERAEEQLERKPSRSDPLGDLQRKTKDPPRVAPAFLGDVDGQTEFVPVAKAAEIDRLLERCPQCHHTEAAARAWVDRATFAELLAWIEAKATPLELDELADLIERKRA